MLLYTLKLFPAVYWKQHNLETKTWAQPRRMSRIWKCSDDKNITLLRMLYVLWKHALRKTQEIRKSQSTWWLRAQRLPFLQQLPFSSTRQFWKLPIDVGHCSGSCLLPFSCKAQEGLLRFPHAEGNPDSWLPSRVCQAAWTAQHCPWSPRTGLGANGLGWELRVKGVVYTLENSIPRAVINLSLVTVETVLRSQFLRLKW